MKFTVIRFLKSTFIRLRLHVLFAPLESFFIQLAYLSKLSKWVAKHTITDNDFVTKWDYNKRYNLYQSIFEKEYLHTAINYLEFGVADGYSFKWWLKKNTNPASKFYGFDTFTGLPEDFGPYKKGTFNSNNAVPDINDERGQFFQGLFQQTLPKFIQTFEADKRLVLMLDADLYSSTLFTLCTLAPYLKNGD
ncbi:MAG: class I SAM-dependent methyltransferase, partial [Ginsengibacter sp.]